MLAELYAALSVEQLKVFSENLGKRIIIKDSITPIEFIPAEKDIELMEILHRPHLLARPPVGESFDAVKSRKDLIRSDAFLKAWGGVVPDVERRRSSAVCVA